MVNVYFATHRPFTAFLVGIASAAGAALVFVAALIFGNA